ncbi:transcriptional regulator [Aliiruegeria haliotis]|uniref:Transcriptional regulator n=1 Tax=Aliiruegeria haliotis TaxID=1280846 RepID=A0A2T0RM23_9RHOB|nr:AAA family ATPase [Aliiruegeria haliotis]PRY22218.1 transcriptional regulator [Aliiruegeria haliotis]
MIYRFGDFRLDTVTQELSGADGPIAVEPQVFAMLVFLIENRSQVVSKDDLVDAIWDGRIVSDATISSRMNLARQAVGDSGRAQAVIRTFPKRGFRFVAEILQDPEAMPPASHAPLPPQETGASLLVLPFNDFSADGPGPLARGLTEDLIVALSRYRELRVISINSALVLGENASLLENPLAQVWATYLVSGSVRQAGDSLRVTVQLSEKASGATIWAEAFDRLATDLFRIQDEIVTSIAGQLPWRLLDRASRDAASSTPEPRLSSHQAFLRASWDLSRADITRKIAEFQKIVDDDPKHALAQALLGFLIAYSVFETGQQTAQDRARSLDHAREALALGPDNERVLSHAAMTFLFAGEFTRARRYSDQAISINPNSTDCTHLHATILGATGDAEAALECHRRTMELDPLFPEAHFEGMIEAHFLLGRYGDALDLYDRFSEPPSHVHLHAALCHALSGNDGMAAQLTERFLTQAPPGFSCPVFVEAVMRYHARAEDRDHWRRGYLALDLPGVSEGKIPSANAPTPAEPARERRAITLVAILPPDLPRDPEAFEALAMPLRARIADLADDHGGLLMASSGPTSLCVFGAGSPIEHHTNDALSFAGALLSEPGMDSLKIGVVRGDAIFQRDTLFAATDHRVVAHLAAGAVELAQQGAQGSIAFDLPVEEAMRPTLDDGDHSAVPFVARETELAQLLAELRTGGRFVGIVGEAGIGKTALIQAALASNAAQRFTVLTIDTRERSKGTAFEPLRRLFMSWRSEGAVPGELAPTLRHFVDQRNNDPTWRALSPTERRRSVGALFRHTIDFYARKGPLVLVLEDLHWIDPETEALIGQVIDDLPGSEISVLATYRPDYENAWAGRSFFRQISLGPLDDDASRQLLHALLEPCGDDVGAIEALISRTAGIPLFLVESARHADAADMASDPPAVPPTVRDILSARIQQIPTAARRSLQCAAILGTNFSESLLTKLADQKEEVCEEHLAELRAREIVRRNHNTAQAEHRFQHALLYEAAYASMLRKDRQALHRRALDLLSDTTDTSGDTTPDRAHHALQAQEWRIAGNLYRQAGDSFAELSAYSSARDAYTLAIGALRNLPRATDVQHEIVDLHIRLRPVLVPLGEYQATVGHLEKAEQIVRQLDDPCLTAATLIGKSYLFSTHGRLAAAIASGEQAVQAAPVGSQQAQEARLALGQALSMAGDWSRAIATMEPTLPFWDEHPDGRFGQTGTRAVWCHGHIARCHRIHGSVKPARQHAERCLELAEKSRRPFDMIFARHRLAEAILLTDTGDEAFALLNSALELAEAIEAPILECWVVADFAPLLIAQGQTDRAEKLLATQREAAENLELAQFHAWIVAGQARLRLEAGHLQQAETLAEEALSAARNLGDNFLQAVLLREVSARISDAPHRLELALDIASKYGFLGVSDLCRRALASLT